MAEETSTRTALRRKICKELRMPFFRRVGQSSTVAASSSTSSIIDTKLTQPDATWNGSWFFNVTTGEVSLIRSFTANDDTFRIESPCLASPVGNSYEIHSIWNANEVHDAINEAIRLGRRTFPDTSTNETLVFQEEKLTYDVSALTKIPWVINKIWVEQRPNVIRGNIVAGYADSAELDCTLPADIDANWKITIYAGKGAGQVRDVLAISSPNIIEDLVAWTVIPDTTSKYCLFDASEEFVTWRPFNDFHLDVEEFPDTIYINKLYPSLYGMRMRLEMISISNELTTEAGTTNIPAEYIKAKACSILHGQALSNTKADKDTHYAEYKRYMDEADSYVVRNAVHAPGTRFRSPNYSGDGGSSYTDHANPLGWYNE